MANIKKTKKEENPEVEKEQKVDLEKIVERKQLQNKVLKKMIDELNKSEK